MEYHMYENVTCTTMQQYFSAEMTQLFDIFSCIISQLQSYANCTKASYPRQKYYWQNNKIDNKTGKHYQLFKLPMGLQSWNLHVNASQGSVAFTWKWTSLRYILLRWCPFQEWFHWFSLCMLEIIWWNNIVRFGHGDYRWWPHLNTLVGGDW